MTPPNKGWPRWRPSAKLRRVFRGPTQASAVAQTGGAQGHEGCLHGVTPVEVPLGQPAPVRSPVGASMQPRRGVRSGRALPAPADQAAWHASLPPAADLGRGNLDAGAALKEGRVPPRFGGGEGGPTAMSRRFAEACAARICVKRALPNTLYPDTSVCSAHQATSLKKVVCSTWLRFDGNVCMCTCLCHIACRVCMFAAASVHMPHRYAVARDYPQLWCKPTLSRIANLQRPTLCGCCNGVAHAGRGRPRWAVLG